MSPTYKLPNRYTYIIRKSSRSNITPYSCGLTCEEANVPCEELYTDRNKALEDAKKLANVNPVGFDVVRVARLRDRKPICSFIDVLKKCLIFGLVKL